MRLVTALLIIAFALVGPEIDLRRVDARTAAAAAPGNGTPPAPPFLALQTGIDAVQEKVEALAARSGGLRVYDGEGRDVGRYLGRDALFNFVEPSDSFLRGPIHVFFEDTGVTASYSPDGQLARFEGLGPKIWFILPDCQGPAFVALPDVVLASPFGPEVMVTGTQLHEILAESRIIMRGGGSLHCRNRSSFTTLYSAQFFDPAEIGIPLQIPPLLYTAPAE
jgi:hypothetical protein